MQLSRRPDAAVPDGQRPTILLIHGLWVTPRSWEHFHKHYEDQGYDVLAPAWPGIVGDVEDMQRNPSSFNGISIEDVVAHYTAIIETLAAPPIIIGHSYGGLVTQVLMDKGLGVAGVAINSVPPKGIIFLPLATIRAITPALLNPFVYRRTFSFSFKRFWRVFANALTESEARAAYKRYAIAAPGKALYQAALSNITPRSGATVNCRNNDRGPLLLIGGEIDNIMPASLNRKNFRKYKRSKAVTEYHEFPGRSHFIIGEKNWEEVADYALSWAMSHAQAVHV